MRGSSRRRPLWGYLGLVVLVLLAAGLVPMAVRAADQHPTAQPMPVLTPSSGMPLTIFIGDSSVVGAGVTRSSGRWSSIASKVLKWDEVNLARTGSSYAATTATGGCDGRTTCRTYADEIEAVKKRKPDLVVVGGGRKAAGSDARTTVAVRNFYKALRTALPDATIIAVGPWTAEPADDKSVAVLDDAVQAAARSANAVYVSLLDPKLIDRSMTTDQGKSLNDIGHQKVADRIVTTINQGDS